MMRSLKQLESDYDIYRLSVKEILVSAIEGILIIGIFGYFFYRSLFITILALPLIYFYILYKSVIIKQKRKSELRYQFKEILVSVSGSIRAGYSLENAFLEAEKDIISFYGKEALIANELSVLRTGLKNNKTITTLITDMSKRCEIQEMKEFADVLVIGKQTGGNLTDIIDSYIKIAEDKFQIIQEIETIVSSRRYEQRIMDVIPFLIIFYIEITNRGFFDVLYTSVLGRVIMTFCLMVYLAAYAMAERITNIEI